MSFRAHCKLTRRRRSKSIDITVTTLWLRCSSSSEFTHKCKKSKFIRLNKKHFRFQSYAHFTLVWREPSMLIAQWSYSLLVILVFCFYLTLKGLAFLSLFELLADHFLYFKHRGIRYTTHRTSGIIALQAKLQSYPRKDILITTWSWILSFLINRVFKQYTIDWARSVLNLPWNIYLMLYWT